MSTELFIARRYLLTNRKGMFSRGPAILGVGGVAVGVAVLIATFAVMNGFQSDIKNRILDAQAHVTIYGSMSPRDIEVLKAELERDGRVSAMAPYVLGQGLLTFKGNSAGMMLKGLDPAREFCVNNLKAALVRGSWDALEKPAGGGPQAIMLGEELAKNLGVWLGDEAVLVSLQGGAAGLGMIPKMKKFKVAGIMRTGYYLFDNTMAYCALGAAGDFFGLSGGATGAGMRLKNIENAGAVAAFLRKSTGLDHTVKTYADMNQELFAALRLEKLVMSLVLAFTIIVATFNIASNLLMMSLEKMRDIGIVRAIGAGPDFIRRIFFWEGNLIALSGIALGIVLGVGVSLFISVYPVVELPSEIYYVTKLPVELRLLDVVGIAAVTYLLCMVSTLFPAREASKISPMEAIHYG